MRRAFSILILLATMAVLGAAPPAPSSSLTERIDALLQDWRASDAFWGVSIYDLDAGEMVYAHNPGHGFLPASNQKLLTTATALDVFGGTHRYETTLHFRGSTEGTTLRGDLILRGSGDPTFGSTAVRAGDPLRAWAERLAEMGVERVEGRLIGDDDAFDDRSYPAGWTIGYVTRQKGRQIGVSAGALAYQDNVVPVTVQATAPGQPPQVQAQPPGVLSIDNQATTSARWRGNTLRVERTFSTNELTLTGSVTQSYDGGVAVPVSDPTAFVLHSFRKHLADTGIDTTALAPTDVDDIDGGAPESGSPLFVSHSPPLSDIVSAINKESNNFYAEQVFRSYGWGGSVRGGARRTEAFLREADIDTRTLRITDGSGLSRKNLVTARAMAKLLAHMDDHDERDTFRASLPQGGERNTTLDTRLYGTSTRAKTGSLASVRALSGYAKRPDGTRVAFAVFANQYTGPSYPVVHTIDDIVRAITSSPS